MHYLPIGARLNKGILMVTQLILGFSYLSFGKDFIVGTNDSLKAIAYIYLRPFSLLYLRRITEDVLACKSVLIVYGLV